jgi:hypothetical protein
LSLEEVVDLLLVPLFAPLEYSQAPLVVLEVDEKDLILGVTGSQGCSGLHIVAYRH